MKKIRFFCTICNHNKLVARRPDNVHEITDDNDKIVGYSQGTCNFHGGLRPNMGGGPKERRAAKKKAAG